jgi:hypothetical protein
MRSFLKLFGIIAFIAVIGFSMSACTLLQFTGMAEGNAIGAHGWPTNEFWDSIGLAGLQQPPGTEAMVITSGGQRYVGVSNGGRASFDNLIAQIRGIRGTTQVTEETRVNNNTYSVSFNSTKGNMIALYFNPSDNNNRGQVMITY